MDRRELKFLLLSIFIVVLVKVDYKDRKLNKYIKTSTNDKMIEFKVLKTQKR